MGENTRQNCTRQNKKKNPGRKQACWGSLFCTNLTQPTGNLDRKNSEEILALLKLSNKRYHQTIVLITHDERIALEADRVITIEDGRILQDSRQSGGEWRV